MRKSSKLDIHHTNRTCRSLHKIKTLFDWKQHVIEQYNIGATGRIGIP
jgi:hypothetical protein